MTSVPAWIYWALLSAGFAGLTAILAKVGVQNIDSNWATLIRTLVVLGFLAAIVIGAGRRLDAAAVPARTWLFLVLSGLATGASWLCYFRALQLGDASKVAPIDKLSVVLVAIFAFVFLGERPALQDWAGIALIAAGSLLLVLKL